MRIQKSNISSTSSLEATTFAAENVCSARQISKSTREMQKSRGKVKDSISHDSPHLCTHLLPCSVYEQVEGDGSHHVDEEPAFEVMHGDPQRVTDHLVVGVDVGGAEVDDDVDDEHDVHDEVHHVERTAGVAAVLHGSLLLLVEQEGGGVRREDGRVDDQQQDQPVPHRLKRAVVQNRPLVDARSLELVLRQNISAQRQHLDRKREEGTEVSKLLVFENVSLEWH